MERIQTHEPEHEFGALGAQCGSVPHIITGVPGLRRLEIHRKIQCLIATLSCRVRTSTLGVGKTPKAVTVIGQVNLIDKATT